MEERGDVAEVVRIIDTKHYAEVFAAISFQRKEKLITFGITFSSA